MNKSLRIVCIAEFRYADAATGALVKDLLDYLQARFSAKISFVHSHQKYRPGGMRPVRLFNLVALHGLMPFVVLASRLRRFLNLERTLIITTTSPPLIQWSAIFWGRVFGVPVLCWYQDAHPEIEARFFDLRGLRSVATCLRWLDFLLLRGAAAIVTLDDAMRDLLAARVRGHTRIQVVPPWATYLGTGKALRLPVRRDKLRLIYAGNYGVAHDLSPLAGVLARLSIEIQGRIELTFVGMNDVAKENLKGTFAKVKCPQKYLPRFDSLGGLLAVMEEQDFGVVSQKESYAGLVAPSKSYTYLSQGLPILYVGAPGTFPAKLTEQGWGCAGAEEFFRDWVSVAETQCGRHRGLVYPPPKALALKTFEELVEHLMGAQ